MHYTRIWTRNNRPPKYNRLQKHYTLQERLNLLSKLNPETGCIEWINAINKVTGYGKLQVNHKAYAAHVLSWELKNKKSAKGLVIRHTCDNRKCINPDHLIAGTHADNMKDKVSRNRHIKGSQVPNAKLDENKVKDIFKLLSLGYTQSYIAQGFGVKPSVISCIKNRKYWKHVQTEECVP